MGTPPTAVATTAAAAKFISTFNQTPPLPRSAVAAAVVAATAAADPDWFAAMSALEKVQKVQQARALQQLRSHHPGSHRHSSITGGAADDDTEAWYDARSHTMSDSSVAYISDAEREEVARLAHEIEESEHAQGQLTVSVVRELEPATPNCVPNPPLLFAEKHWKYIPVRMWFVIVFMINCCVAAACWQCIHLHVPG
jgi:hypothetical protein